MLMDGALGENLNNLLKFVTPIKGGYFSYSTVLLHVTI